MTTPPAVGKIFIPGAAGNKSNQHRLNKPTDVNELLMFNVTPLWRSEKLSKWWPPQTAHSSPRTFLSLNYTKTTTTNDNQLQYINTFVEATVLRHCQKLKSYLQECHCLGTCWPLAGRRSGSPSGWREREGKRTSYICNVNILNGNVLYFILKH